MRHALAYGSFFSAVGLLSTYMPVHLQRFGLTAATIGTLFGVRTAIATASQLLLTPRLPPHRVGWALVLSAAWAAAFGLGVALASDAVWLMALILVIAPGQALAIPLLDTVVIDQLGADRFGAVRRWGSIGYGVTVGAVAWWAQGRSYAEVGRLAAMGFAVMLALTLVQMVFVARPSAGTATQADGSTTGSVPRDPALVGFFLINGLHWIGGAQFNVFISLHAQRLGLDPSVPGAAIAAMIVGEVLAMSAVGRLLPHWGLGRLYAVVFAGGFVRFALTAAASSGPAVVVLQLLNFLTFGLWLPLAFRLLRERFARSRSAVGLQGLFYAFVFGGGTMVASATGGFLLEAGGGRLLFGTGAFCEALALLGFFFLRPRLLEAPA